MPVSSSEGTRLYQRKTSKESAPFFPLVFKKQGNRSQDSVSVKYLIMRGSIYYAHKEISLLPWASIFSFFLSSGSFAGVKKGRAYRAYTCLLPHASIPTGIHFPSLRLSHLGVWA